MKKIIVLSLLTAISVFGRENPFRSGAKENLAGSSMEQVNIPERFQTITITPPVESIKIRKITIEYLDVDGMRIKKTYDIQTGLDPLKPIKITQ